MFDYDAAFSRNLGWTTEWEQAALRTKCVAIAGMGGVGGSHLLALTRLGIGRFAIADFDRFDTVNLNRQAGANASTIGRPKVDVLAEMALSINPELGLATFGEGVTRDNLDRFLAGCDLFVDGLDFFALDMRARVFARCAELGIPAFTAAPIGLGVGFIAFLPGRQSFEDYFRLLGQTDEEQYLRFLMGVAPRGLHRAYLADDSRVDLANRRGPSTVAACEFCAGMVATQALKLLLGRGGVPVAPDHLTMDAYRGRAVWTRMRWGQAGPLQRLKLMVARRVYGAMARRAPINAVHVPHQSELHAILDAARWAPSGDNAQPWRFEILSDHAVRIHMTSEATMNPYDYRAGEPTLLAGGMLLESLGIAASAYQRGMEWTVSGTDPWQIDVAFSTDRSIGPSPLLSALPMRSVERRAMGARPLDAPDMAALQDALGTDLVIAWHASLRERMAMARLGAAATAIRLRAPETYAVHRRVVDWSNVRSPAGLPARAIGLNGPTLGMMRWAMTNWDRMRRLNSVMGTAGAALQLDLVPALRSSAFFSIRMVPPIDGANRAETLLRHGARLQRFWLTATRRGLAIQPALATLIFADHGSKGTKFTADAALRDRAGRLAKAVHAELGPVDRLVFLGRVGWRLDGMPRPRSVRRPLQTLIVADAGAASGADAGA